MSSFIPTTPKQRLVVWFKNDLRIHDHPILYEISKKFKSLSEAQRAQQELLCVYCFDPRYFQTTKFRSFKTQIFRANFLIESVANLRKNLQSIGSDLLVTVQRPEEIIPKLFPSGPAPAQKNGIPGPSVFVSQEVTYEEQTIERAVEKALRAIGVRLERVRGANSLLHPDDLPYAQPSLGDLPNTFTTFREQVEGVVKVRPLMPTPLPANLPAPPTPAACPALAAALSERCSFSFLPSLRDLGFSEGEVAAFEAPDHPRRTKAAMLFTGGEEAGLRRVEEWMFRDDRLRDYFALRNGMLGEAYSSKLSPWLALGCLSPRLVEREVRRYEAVTGVANKSTYWLVFELLWRDFFAFFAVKHGARIFFPQGAVGRMGKKPATWRDRPDLLQRWKDGRTGVPLVDANMRELQATGWMSNRGRQNAASFLVFDLQLDWRAGADHFESLLLDFDVASNYGNWNAAAGLTGGRLNKFNVLKQSHDYDPAGRYIRHWLPKLAAVPAPQIFEPWKLSAEEQRRYGVRVGDGEGCDYPAPAETVAAAWAGYQYDGEASHGQRRNWGAHFDQPALPKQPRYQKGKKAAGRGSSSASQQLNHSAGSNLRPFSLEQLATKK